MKICIITPARNEESRLPAVADSLAKIASGELIFAWWIVDDGSVDRTCEIARQLSMQLPVRVLNKANQGGLRGGSAFKSFFFGADLALDQFDEITHVMKLDADVLLASDFFSKISSGDVSGLVGGVAVGRSDREQIDLVPGFCKVYSRQAYQVVRALPASIGLDVIDETALREAGLSVRVEPRAHVRLLRSIGYSEGLLKGRNRNGIVSRWVGYDPLYFSFRLVRYLFRRPALVGALVMAFGYVRAGRGPYPARLKVAFRRAQRAKLRRILRSPRRELATLYAYPKCDDFECCAQT